MCDVLGVSRSGYYQWRKRRPSAREREDERLGTRLCEAFEKSHRTYGARRLREDLIEEGESISRRRSRRLMRRNALVARRPKGWVPRTTDSFGTTRIAPNLLGQDFSTERVDQKWVSDITYIATDQGWLYLCVVLDLSNRGVVGYAMSKNIDASLVSNIVEYLVSIAIQLRKSRIRLLTFLLIDRQDLPSRLPHIKEPPLDSVVIHFLDDAVTRGVVVAFTREVRFRSHMRHEFHAM